MEQFERMKSNNGNIVMNVASKEESVEELIKKLNERGTKVKIVNDDDGST
jgi:precorrin-6B methylase 2